MSRGRDGPTSPYIKLMVRTISNCAWLLIDTRTRRSEGFRDQLSGASDFRTIYRSPRAVNKHRTDHAEQGVLTVTSNSIDRSLDKRDVRDEHRRRISYNDDAVLDDGGRYLLFNYFAITGSCVACVLNYATVACRFSERFNPLKTFND